MNTSEYITRRNTIIENVHQQLNIWEDAHRLVSFNLTSANLLHYLPGIDYSRHETLFREILLHQQLSALEQFFHPITQYATCENLSPQCWQMIREKPVIFCTFHTGSYRLINLMLMKHQVPYSLAIAGDILEQQGNSYLRIFDELYDGYIYPDFHLINAEQPYAALQMLRDLKKGRSLLLYLDGNTGSGSFTTENENCCIVSFLHQSLFARKGIAYLSHSANVPIVPVICYRKSLDDIRLRFFDPLYPDTQQSRHQFAETTTQLLYQLFETVLQQYPGQWEAWLYLHKTAHLHRQPAGNNQSAISGSQNGFSLNQNKYGLFKIGLQNFLFNKCNYESQLINDNLYKLLYEASHSLIHRQAFSYSQFRRLLQDGVLLPAHH